MHSASQKLTDVMKNNPLLVVETNSCKVTLIDVMPRKVLRTVEDSIIRSARTSTTMDMKSPEEDAKLILYLLKNFHTSPLEAVKFSFIIDCPIFVARHFLRHRTANVNEFSQRYSRVDKGFYRPSSDPEGIRLQARRNKQSSEIGELSEEVLLAFQEAEEAAENSYQKYLKLVELGVAREVARFCLPLSTWTTINFTIDLNNFLKMLRLRLDKTSQKESRDVAEAMWKLTRDLMPTVRDWFEQSLNSA